MDDLTQKKAYEQFKQREFATYKELIMHYTRCMRETCGRALAAESAAQFDEIIAETEVLCEAFLLLRSLSFPVAEVRTPASAFRAQQANRENRLRREYIDQFDPQGGSFFFYCERQFAQEGTNEA